MIVNDLQMNPYVSDLALYDIQGTPGVAADISHINSKAKTRVSTPATASSLSAHLCSHLHEGPPAH